jgi:hypothetical protein
MRCVDTGCRLLLRCCCHCPLPATQRDPPRHFIAMSRSQIRACMRVNGDLNEFSQSPQKLCWRGLSGQAVAASVAPFTDSCGLTGVAAGGHHTSFNSRHQTWPSHSRPPLAWGGGTPAAAVLEDRPAMASYVSALLSCCCKLLLLTTLRG